MTLHHGINRWQQIPSFPRRGGAQAPGWLPTRLISLSNHPPLRGSPPWKGGQYGFSQPVAQSPPCKSCFRQTQNHYTLSPLRGLSNQKKGRNAPPFFKAV